MQISILLAFVYGLLAFFSACVLPLIPVYLSSLVGPEIFEDKAKRRRLPIFLHASSFMLGFSLVFIFFGAGSGLLGAVLLSRLSAARQISGAMLIIFGLFMFAAMKIPWLNYERRLHLPLTANISHLRSFLLGVAFPVVWIPCASWVLAAILSLAAASHTAWHGAVLLASYSLGLGLPFLIVAVALDFVTPFLKIIRRHSGLIYVISGLLLVVMGILILTDNLGWLPGQI